MDFQELLNNLKVIKGSCFSEAIIGTELDIHIICMMTTITNVEHRRWGKSGNLQEVLANVPIEDLGVASNAVRSGLLLIPPVNCPSISASQERRDKTTYTSKNILLLT